MRRREAGKARERSARRNTKRKSRLGADAERWGRGGHGPDSGDGASATSE